MGCDLTELERKWSSAYVARREVGTFTGGMISPGTVANADSQGEGPEDAVRIGRNVAYPVRSFVRWLETRAVAKKSDMGRARAAKKK